MSTLLVKLRENRKNTSLKDKSFKNHINYRQIIQNSYACFLQNLLPFQSPQLKKIDSNQLISSLLQNGKYNSYQFFDQQISYVKLGKLLQNSEQLQIQIKRNSEIIRLMFIAKQLGIQQILSAISRDINTNFDSYNIFQLLTVSQELQITWLYEKCLKELIIQRFQYLNFNQFELFQLKLQDFCKVIRIHEETVRQKKMKGLTQKRLKQIIRSYCQVNQVQIDIDQLLCYGLKTISEHSSEQDFQFEQNKNLMLHEVDPSQIQVEDYLIQINKKTIQVYSDDRLTTSKSETDQQMYINIKENYLRRSLNTKILKAKHKIRSRSLDIKNMNNRRKINIIKQV